MHAKPALGEKQFEVFHDGDCPLCAREVQFIARLDRDERILFTDISSPSFDACQVGVSLPELIGEIHGRLPDGTLVRGVEVFRQLYGCVGFRRLVAISRWPGVRQTLNAGYRVFARNRLRWTGRCVNGVCATSARPSANRA